MLSSVLRTTCVIIACHWLLRRYVWINTGKTLDTLLCPPWKYFHMLTTAPIKSFQFLPRVKVWVWDLFSPESDFFFRWNLRQCLDIFEPSNTPAHLCVPTTLIYFSALQDSNCPLASQPGVFTNEWQERAGVIQGGRRGHTSQAVVCRLWPALICTYTREHVCAHTHKD